jgi:hypothetical protein
MLAYGLSPERVFGILTWRHGRPTANRVLADRFVDTHTAEATSPRRLVPASTTCS